MRCTWAKQPLGRATLSPSSPSYISEVEGRKKTLPLNSTTPGSDMQPCNVEL